MTIRLFAEADRAALKEITAVCFDGVSIDQNIEAQFGRVSGRDWPFYKKCQIDDDLAAHPAGVFVAEVGGRVVGYITTRVDRTAKVGRIPNFAVLPGQQKQGLGRALMDRAMAHFKSAGMEYVRIETLEQNAVGRHFYPKMGFKEVARQIHYFKRLEDA